MQSIGMFKAKTHLPELVRKVHSGEKIIITNRGQEVAVLVAAKDYFRSANSPIDRLRAILKDTSLGDAEIIMSFRDEGRR